MVASVEERARMRRNQRNSRARKQAYLKDLEHRWNECLRLGVQASADMQQAARKVSHENEQLRKMLHERGLTDDMIKDELLSSPTTGGPSDYSSASKLPTPPCTCSSPSSKQMPQVATETNCSGTKANETEITLQNPDLELPNWLVDFNVEVNGLFDTLSTDSPAWDSPITESSNELPTAAEQTQPRANWNVSDPARMTLTEEASKDPNDWLSQM